MSDAAEQKAGEGTAAEWVEEAAHRRDHKQDPGRSWLEYPATYLLLAVNILVFLVMVSYGPVPALLRHHAFGSVLTAPFDYATIVNFGGSSPIMVLRGGMTFGIEGQWWRLLSAAFVHVTVLHLLINMWCLWNLGLFGEPLLGKPGLCAVYVLTGVAGNLLSLTWNLSHGQPDALVAGASGAVFGIAGILIVLLSNRGLVKDDLTWAEVRSLRQQVVLFAVVNLLFGILPNFLPALGAGALRSLHVDPHSFPRVDNTAHLGGFLSGLVLGLPLFSRMVKGKRVYRARQRVTFATAALVLCLWGYAVASFARK